VSKIDRFFLIFTQSFFLVAHNHIKCNITSVQYSSFSSFKGPEITNLPLGATLNQGQETAVAVQALDLSEPANSCNQVAPLQSEFEVKMAPTTNSKTTMFSYGFMKYVSPGGKCMNRKRVFVYIKY